MSQGKDNEGNVIKALAINDAVAITAIDSTEIAREAVRLHSLSPLAAAALGRLMGGTTIMAAQLKTRGRITAAIKSEGPIGGLIACADDALDVKGYVNNPSVDMPHRNGKLDVGGAVFPGKLTVIRDSGEKEPYVAQVELVSGEIAEDFAYYYAVSEQQPTVIALGVLANAEGVAAASGILAQPLPGADEDVISRLEAKAEQIAAFNRRIAEMPLERALFDIFEDARILERRSARYYCGCSRERLARVIVSMGEAEISEMARDGKGAELVCHFCGSKYFFDVPELEALLKEAKAK